MLRYNFIGVVHSPLSPRKNIFVWNIQIAWYTNRFFMRPLWFLPAKKNTDELPAQQFTLPIMCVFDFDTFACCYHVTTTMLFCVHSEINNTAVLVMTLQMKALTSDLIYVGMSLNPFTSKLAFQVLAFQV